MEGVVLTRAFGYLRISHDPHRTSLSPAKQRHEIERTAKARGDRIVEWFEDIDRSAWRRNVRRPGFDGMVGRIGEVGAIYAWEAVRLARRMVIAMDFMDRLEDSGVRLVSVTQGDSTEVGRVHWDILFAIGAEESRRISERVSSHHRYIATELGRPVSPKRSYGFTYDGTQLSVEPNEAEVIRAMAAAYLTGAGDAEIARRLNDGRLMGASVPPLRAREWGTSSVARLLSSPTVAGWITYRCERVGDEPTQPAILDAETFDLLQAVRAERRKARRRPTTERALLSGLARCEGCKGPLASNGDIDWPSYRCSRAADGHPCRARASAPQRWLDAYVEKWFFETLDRPRLLRRVSEHDASRDEDPAAELRREEARAGVAIERLLDAYASSSSVTRESFDRKLGEYQGRLEVVREKLGAFRHPKRLDSVFPDVRQLWPFLSAAEKREALTYRIESVVVTRGRPRDEANVEVNERMP